MKTNHWSSVASLGLALAAIVCAARVECAETVNLNASTPALQKIKARMAGRDAKIEIYKATGAAGEGGAGLLEARPTANMPLADKKNLHDVIAAENEDRTAMFRELAIANGLADAGTVAAAFIMFKFQSAEPEHWIRDAKTNEWIQKKDSHD